MTKRAVRHDVIREIIRRGNIKTQRDLVEQLRSEGYDCTQYMCCAISPAWDWRNRATADHALPEDLRLQRMVGELVEGIEIVNNFLVVRTPSGIASGVAVALDAAQLKGVAGTLGGRRYDFRHVPKLDRSPGRGGSHPSFCMQPSVGHASVRGRARRAFHDVTARQPRVEIPAAPRGAAFFSV